MRYNFIIMGHYLNLRATVNYHIITCRYLYLRVTLIIGILG